MGFGVSDSKICDVSARAVRRLIEATEREEAFDKAVGLGTSCLYREMHDEARHGLSSCGPDMILTRRERWRQAKVIEGGEDSQMGRTKERQIAQFQIQNRGTSEPVLHDIEITKLPPNPPANESMNLYADGVCIQHLRTSPKVEERRDTSLRLEAARIWNGTGVDVTKDHQIQASTASAAGWHETSIIAFAGLRSKPLTTSLEAVAPPKIEPCTSTKVNDNDSLASSEPRLIPIFTRTTLQLPPLAEQPIAKAIHYYLASLEVLQKQVLVRALRNPDCSVKLIERDTLGGPDLIVDPFTAILYRSLFSLPSECGELIVLVSKLSWSSEQLVIIFEAFPQPMPRGLPIKLMPYFPTRLLSSKPSKGLHVE